MIEADTASSDVVIATRRRAELMLVLMTVIWGSTFPLMKWLMTSGHEPMGLLAIRFLVASACFATLYGRQLGEILEPTQLRRGLLLGVLLYAAYAFQTFGLDLTTSSRAGFLAAMYVLFTPLIQVAVTRIVPSGSVLGGVALVVVGLWLLTAPDGGVMGLLEPLGAGGLNIGDALVIASAVVFAFYILLLDRFTTAGESVLPITALQIGTVALLASLHATIAGDWKFIATSHEWGGILYLAVIATFLTTHWQAHYQRETAPSRAAVIYTLEAVFAAIFAVIFLDEHLSMLAVGGGACILAGLLVVELGDVVFGGMRDEGGGMKEEQERVKGEG